MSVVSSELGVRTLQRRISVSLRLLDAVGEIYVSLTSVLSVRNPASDLRTTLRMEWTPVPVLVSLLGLVVLRRVLGFCSLSVSPAPPPDISAEQLTGHLDGVSDLTCG